MSLALDNTLIEQEAVDFVEGAGLKEPLDEVVRFSSAIFPTMPLHFVLDVDPENPADRQISVRLDATGWNSQQMMAAHKAWFAELVSSSLSTFQRCHFRLHLFETA